MMTALSAYYGEPYAGIVRTLVTDYLDALSDPLRDELFQVVVRKVSRSFGKVPDVAAFESAMNEAYDRVVTPERAMIEQRIELTDEERAEVDRLFAEARKTPAGRMLLGALGEARK